MASSSVGDILTYGDHHLECVQNIIGSGGMGVVSLYKWTLDEPSEGIRKDDKVAVKRLESASDIRSIKEEAKILWKLHEECPYVLRLFGLLESGSIVCLVLEYMQHGNITHFFATLSHDNEYFNERVWPLKLRIAKQVCEAMKFLHGRDKPILHCDLKAANVLLDDDFNVKICDFGLAKIKLLTTRPKSDEALKEKLNIHPAGTVSHVAPELLRIGNRPSKKSDVYSFGILLWELLTDITPYDGICSELVIIKEVLDGKRPNQDLIAGDSPELLKTMMADSWEQDREKRPEFLELRRRFEGSDNQQQQDNSVEYARQTWDRINGQFETRPKSLLEPRSEGGGLPFYTENDRLQPTRECPIISDVKTGDLCISDDKSTESTTTGHTCCSDSPLLDLAPSVPTTPSIVVEGKRHRRLKVVLFGIVLVAIGLPVAALLLGRYILPNIQKGCCLRCFDQYDSGLQSDCFASPPADESVSPPGSSCSFSCRDGFVLNANVTQLTCSPSGTWSGPLPYCRKIRQCRALNPPANGGSMKCTNNNYENSKCTFQCPIGYRMRLADSEEKLKYFDDYDVTCEADPVLNYFWSADEPYCEKVVPCDVPTTDTSVLIQCTTPDFHNGREHNPRYSMAAGDPQYHNGTACIFSCPAQLSLETNEAAGLCLDTGVWNMSSKVTCVKECPYFPDPAKSSYNCTLGRSYNSRCIFTCDGGFVMVGSDNMVCQPTGKAIGQWVNSPPRCECPSCRTGDDCEQNVSFQDTWMTLNTTKAVTYDGHHISCSNIKNSDSYGCQCRDVKRNKVKQCNDKKSDTLACYKAYASLILVLAYNGTYTLPCDAYIMPKMC